MRRVFVSFLLGHLVAFTFGQVITGKVLDRETLEPISFAAVFFDGTFVGTTTDEVGYFKLDVTKYRSRSLTISAIGYYRGSLSDFTPEKPYRILLEPQVFEIGEVSVTTRSLERKRKECLRIFKREFLGNTFNSRRCFIINEQDITFNYGSDRDTLRAFALNPILIQNRSLGYDITYMLDRFEYDRKNKTILFTGNIVFNRDRGEEAGGLRRYGRRRAYTYTGSSMQFFRRLWSNSLKGSGFSIIDYKTGKELQYENIVFQDLLGRKYLQYPDDLEVRYYNEISYFRLLQGSVYFDQDGFFDPTSIIWSGTISLQRIADFLPYEYDLPE